MRTIRKPVCTLVVVLTAVIGYLGVSPGNLQAAPPPWPNVDGHWNTNRGDADLSQGDPGNKYVTGTFMGPYGLVHLSGHFVGSWLKLHVNGVRYDGTLYLKVSPNDNITGQSKQMKGKVYLDGLLPIRWTWTR